MSLIGGGSDCAAGSNPLAQFTKHTQHDTSLQQSMRNGEFQQGNQRMMRNESTMSPMERQQMDQFMQQQNNPAFNFQPMQHELNVMQQNMNAPQQVANNSWNQEFRMKDPMVANSPSAQVQTPVQSTNWAQDFQQAGPEVQHHAQQHQHPILSVPGVRAGIYGGGRLMGGSMMNRAAQMQQQNPAQAQTSEQSQTQWEDQFKDIESMLNSKTQEPKTKQQEQNTFEQVWDDIQVSYADVELTNDQFQAQWEKDFAQYAEGRLNYGEYKYEEKNQFRNDPDAYEIGMRLMESGAKLSEAGLAFEAAVQQDPKHVDAWLKLGEVQTQNEKESDGIAALEKCLELDPTNLAALMTLAISYINDGYDNAAYATLERWIETKYPDIASRARSSNPDLDGGDRIEQNKRVTELFMKAAQLSPDVASMDADVQTGLGVLFYSMEEFDKTIDCFKAAIEVEPDKALNWNRLGAALANYNKPEEAVEAYSRALQLNPNFVRARYNLGVSFINMGRYKEAVEHLLTGISLHEVEGIDASEMSSNQGLQNNALVETLKRAFLGMNRRDLVDKVYPGMGLAQFRKMFDF
ncbi:Peroxisomal membrane signal receptor PTS1 [Komagataella kurtzmanii]|nr:Peroxisomal membrane signal receptor PTS1 [Komagataella kurtzmanii]